MLSIEKFVEYLDQGQIPPTSPEGTSLGGFGYYPGDFEKGLVGRREATERGMWAIVDLYWTAMLATRLEGKKVLEIMAGAGWLAKALSLHGVQITSTDSGDWDSRHSKMRRVYKVQKMEGIDAVREYRNHDVLLISWPPYGDTEICRICEEWVKPIIYIGEGHGGCNAPDEFWDNFNCQEVDVPMMSWDGIHDGVYAGMYKKCQG